MKNKLLSAIGFIERDRRVAVMNLTLVGAFLFLASLNFLDRYLVWTVAAAVLFCLLSLRNLRLSPLDLAPLLFVLSISIHGGVTSSRFPLQPFVYLFCYLIGANLPRVLHDGDRDRKRRADARAIVAFFGVFALGMALRMALNMWVSKDIDAFRVSIDIWTGLPITATLQSALAIFSIGFSAAILFSDAPILIKPLAVALCALVNFYNLQLGGRSPLLITLLVFPAAYLFMMVGTKKRKLRILMTAAILILAVAAIFGFLADVGGLRTTFEESNFYKRFFAGERGIAEFIDGVLNDSRVTIKRSFLENLPLSIWGGSNIHAATGNFAHDIFLDAYDAWGIVTFVLLIGYLLLAAARTFAVIFDRSVNLCVRACIFSIELALILIFCLEPIWFGAPWLFAAFCFVDGTAAYLWRTRAARRAPIVRPITVTFFSSNLNHHTLPLCRELIARLGEDNFRFVSTEPISQARLSLGYEDMDSVYSFVLREYAGERESAEARRLCRESDVVIFGSAPIGYFRARALTARPLFLYSERLDKPILYGKFGLRRRVGTLLRYATALLSHKAYLLAASGFAARDFARSGLFVGSAYKWGYFPGIESATDPESLLGQKDARRIVWVGRFTRFKHPERAIALAARLRDAGVDFELDMIGNGELEGEIAALIEREDLAERVHLLGALPHTEVREQMKRAAIFLFTSDQSEGWGAVLNEAMSAACAVVTTDAPGSVPFLARSGENALVVPDGDAAALAAAVRTLLSDESLRRRLSLEARATVSEDWNAAVAAERLVALSRAVLPQEATRAPKLYASGVVSKAKVRVKS